MPDGTGPADLLQQLEVIRLSLDLVGFGRFIFSSSGLHFLPLLGRREKN